MPCTCISRCSVRCVYCEEKWLEEQRKALKPCPDCGATLKITSSQKLP